jgi:hypothetical protein
LLFISKKQYRFATSIEQTKRFKLEWMVNIITAQHFHFNTLFVLTLNINCVCILTRLNVINNVILYCSFMRVYERIRDNIYIILNMFWRREECSVKYEHVHITWHYIILYWYRVVSKDDIIYDILIWIWSVCQDEICSLVYINWALLNFSDQFMHGKKNVLQYTWLL